jgi:Ca-activated chloride channel homolog
MTHRSSLASRRSLLRRSPLIAWMTFAAIAPGCSKKDHSALRSEGRAADRAAAASPTPMPPEPMDPSRAGEGSGTEAYRDYGRNPWVQAAADRFSTFAADVDTASYTIARRKLNEGSLPPPASVRVEEFVNYFRYAFPQPDHGPFAVVAEAAPSPFTKGRHIVRVGVATKEKSISERKPMNLVFLVDTSGSMDSADKLGLARRALHILVDNLKDGDTVALTTYAGASRVVLPAVGLEQREQILSAIDSLGASGSTAMASGIELAYREAAKHARPEALSRVIVLSDGDANVGPSSHQEILALIAEHARAGISLSTIGFGMGNYKDETMEQLADKGDGNNFYIDSMEQAKRVFQEQLGSTLEIVAKDVKLQVEFDPLMVARYRLLGYENRDVADRDFRNDQVDAGEVGAGHQVTAMYEVELTDVGRQAPSPILQVHARYKAPTADLATETSFPMLPSGMATSFAAASSDFRFAFAVSAFADILRRSEDAEHWTLAAVRELASAAVGAYQDRRELVALIDQARALSGKTAQLAE